MDLIALLTELLAKLAWEQEQLDESKTHGSLQAILVLPIGSDRLI